jgi:hypothetical protein
MILRKLEFELINNDINYAYNVKQKAKFITNYINRNCLSKIKYVSNDFNILVIYLTENTIEPYVVNKGLVVPLLFERNKFDKIKTKENYFEYFNEKIERAFETIMGKYEIPKNNIAQTLNELKEKNYENKWVYKAKTVKEEKLSIVLNCELTIDDFTLILRINKNNKTLFNEIILKTDPDEVAYEYRFKDILLENNTVIITAKNGDKLYTYKIEAI